MNTVCPFASGETPTLYVYGELDAGARRDFDEHLRECAACRAVLADLEQVRVALAPRAAVMRSAREWDAFMRRLDDRLGPPSRFAPSRPAARGTRLPARGTWLALAAALLLGIALGLLWQQRALGPSHEQVADAAVSEAAFERAAARHFERAKLVVLGLAMKDASRAGAGDWEYERELASSLLPDTRLFRLSAMDRGDSRLAGLLGDLEAVLLQAALAGDAEPPELQRIQRIIRGRDLIVRMNLQDDTTRGI